VDSCGVCGGDDHCSANITLENPDTNFTLAQLSVSLRVSTDLITDVAYLTDNSLRFTLLPSDSMAGLSSQELIGLLNVSSVTVARLSTCGNLRCELGEACTTTTCLGGAQCLQDCPMSNTSCPTTTAKVCSGHGDCVGLPGFCSCRSGYTGPACNLCAPRHIRVGSVCTFLPGALTSCGDGIHNGNEEGVDCGGPNCGACSDTPLTQSTKKVLLGLTRQELVMAASITLAGLVLLLGLLAVARVAKRARHSIQPMHCGRRKMGGSALSPRRSSKTRLGAQFKLVNVKPVPAQSKLGGLGASGSGSTGAPRSFHFDSEYRDPTIV